MKNLLDILLCSLIMLFVLIAPYIGLCLFIKVLSWCFGFIFSWRAVLGVYIIVAMILLIKLMTSKED
ncbi:hypothetical protein KTQ83_00855 [Holdemanella porci]|uniref:hypothetical protein n=1 Tax=Holdemanella porci TaxID=2652276 RepID=UPI001C280A87|nr:hypothetical protein [Holdemanella porci]MBU9130889.1 hypothetical protein [Holdemanella porci]MBU9871100.1 hypothetical protein [Holdemanella porci]MBU9886103.1 hypothetical protein [Holdemanella porci]